MAGQPGESRIPPAVMMGVCGCGKTVAGSSLARILEVPFVEGDVLHPPENVARMARGEPLTDEDRVGWLEAVAREIAGQTREGGGAVAACSALKRRYRDQLRRSNPGLVFLHLAIDPETARQRVAARPAHFMPSSLVDSQFAALEPLQQDEAGLSLDGRRPVEDIVAEAAAFLRSQARPAG